MTPRNPDRYRIEAARLRYKAAHVKDDAALQKRYLALAQSTIASRIPIEQQPYTTTAR